MREAIVRNVTCSCAVEDVKRRASPCIGSKISDFCYSVVFVYLSFLKPHNQQVSYHDTFDR